MLLLQRSSSEFQRITYFKRCKIEIKNDKERDDFRENNFFLDVNILPCHTKNEQTERESEVKRQQMKV